MDKHFGDSTTQPPPSSLTESKYGLLNIFVLGFFFGIVIYFIAWELLDRLFLLGSKLGWVKKDAVLSKNSCHYVIVLSFAKSSQPESSESLNFIEKSNL